MNKIGEELSKLERQILSKKGTDNKFKTFSLETAMGKTTTAEKSIIKYLKNPLGNKKNRFVLVTKFAVEGIQLAKNIYEGLDGKYIIKAYNHEKKIADELDPENLFTTNKLNGLREANVIIITHAMYVNICKVKNIQDKSNTHYILRDILKDFNTLIIDEEINLVKETFGSIDNLKLERLYKLFNSLESSCCIDLFIAIKNFLSNILYKYRELADEGTISSRYMCRVKEKHVYESIEETEFFLYYKKYIAIIVNNIKKIDDLTIKRCESNNKIKLGTKNDIEQELIEIQKCIEALENESVIYMPSSTNKSIGSLNFYDENIEYFKLKNNIYMDASACFNEIYKLSNEFEVLETERLIDHSNCTIVANLVNTSATKKRNIDETRAFNREIIKEIKDINDDVLVINSKEECDFMLKIEKELGIDESKIEYTNFQNMRGKNNWKDYKYCYITHTPNLPFSMYVFMWEYYVNKRATDEEMICRNSKFNVYKFVNSEEISQIYFTDLASSFYQGIKRVCRSRNPSGEFHLYTKAGHAMAIVKKQLLNVNWEVIKDVKTRKGSKAEEIKIWINEEWDGSPIKTKDMLLNLGIDQKKFDKIKEKNKELKDFIKSFEIKRGWYAK